MKALSLCFAFVAVFLLGSLCQAQTEEEIDSILAAKRPGGALNHICGVITSNIGFSKSRIDQELGIDSATLKKLSELEEELLSEAYETEKVVKEIFKKSGPLVDNIYSVQCDIFNERVTEILTEKQVAVLTRISFQVGFQSDMEDGLFDEFLNITPEQHSKLAGMRSQFTSGKLKKSRKDPRRLEQFVMAELTEKQQDLVLRMVGPPFKDGWVEAFLKEREEKKKEEERQRELNSKREQTESK